MQSAARLQQASGLCSKSALRSTRGLPAQQPRLGRFPPWPASALLQSLRPWTAVAGRGEGLFKLNAKVWRRRSAPQGSSAATWLPLPLPLPAGRPAARGPVAVRAEIGETPLDVLRKENELLKATINSAETAGKHGGGQTAAPRIPDALQRGLQPLLSMRHACSTPRVHPCWPLAQQGPRPALPRLHPPPLCSTRRLLTPATSQLQTWRGS